MIVLPGPASSDLANRLVTELNTDFAHLIFKRFPDGENYIRVEGDLRDRDVVIVQTTSPPQDERLMQLFLTASVARNQGAHKIIAAVPYFAYSRQDRVFLPGEAFSVKTIVEMLETCGVDRILTVNAHNHEALASLAVPIEDLSAIPLLAEHFKCLGFGGAVALSMGKKGAATAEEAAEVLQGPSDYIPTRRDRYTGKVTIEEKPLRVKDQVAIIFDDIISSGGTMMKAVAHTKKQGASKVYAAGVHPLLMNDAWERILLCGAEKVVGTDSVPSPVSVVSVAPIIARALTK